MINKLKNMIIDNYLINVNKIEKNEESTVGNVYIIYTDENKYVLKIYDDLNHTKSMIHLHTDLYKKLNIPKIIFNKCNEGYTKLESDKYIALYSILNGIQLGKKFKEIPDEIIIELAHTLKQFHDATDNINKYNLREIPFEYDKKIKRCSTLHFDLTKGNIFCTENKIGFIDFDDAKYGPSVCDVAIITSILFFSKKRGVNIKGLNLFIGTYYKENKSLKNLELPYIKTLALKWIDYVMSSNEFNSSITESFKVKKELIEMYMNL